MIPREEVGKVVVAAVVGSVVALLVSPILQTASFLINEYLARPILSIEYIELVAEPQRVSLPSAQIQALLVSQGYRASLMQGFGGDARLMAFQGRDEISSAELPSVKASVERFSRAVERRLSDLATSLKALSSSASEAAVRAIAAKYGSGAPLFAASQDVTSLRSALLATIQTESESLREAAQLAEAVLKALAPPQVGEIGLVRFKLSVLNRGNTDGLVRHVGELKVTGTPLVLAIRRSSPPTRPFESVVARGVPVAVTNPPADSERPTAVGKVEKNSMSEFWVEVDDTASPQGALTTLRRLIGEGKVDEVEIVLFDHQNKRIEHRFRPPQRPNNDGRSRRDS